MTRASSSTSCRTLYHPSFMTLYSMSAHNTPGSGASATSDPVEAIVPEEVFYSDPSMAPGTRILNSYSRWEVLDEFQLNTPPPVMSRRVTPPTTKDPFRSGHHSVRELGCPTWTGPPGRQNRLIIELTQVEDQVITSLLTLYYQSADPPMAPKNTSEPPKLALNLGDMGGVCGGSERQRSDAELDVAQILLSGFSDRNVGLPVERGFHDRTKS